jgi:hypothetical protein
MASVALVRPNTRRLSVLPRWIVAAGYRVIDINNWQQIYFSSVGDDGRTDCLFEGVPLQAFTAVIFYGAPDCNGSTQRLDEIDQIFITQERNQSVLAAILASKTRLINCGFWIDFSQILTEPESQLRVLSAIGWKTPSVFGEYDLIGAHQEKRRIPEPDERALLVLTKHRHLLIPDAVRSSQLGTLIDKTQEFLADFDVDWCVIALGFRDTATVAYGLSAELPEVLPLSVAKELIRDAIRSARR